ncbi:hypothetical protein AgCh_037239 [Apium graveolens]
MKMDKENFEDTEMKIEKLEDVKMGKLKVFNVLMETKTNSSVQYETPLGYCIEDIRPNGGIKKFRSAAYSDCARKPS